MNPVPPLAEPVTLAPRKGGLLVGVLLALAVLAGALSASRWSIDPGRFLFSYLTALTFVTSLGVGAMAWLMFHHLTGAVWSVAIRRMLENLTRPLVWIVVFFIPVFLNLNRLYEWADPARVLSDPGLARKAVWLNPAMFTTRAAVYLALWALVSTLLVRQSARMDKTGELALTGRMRATSAWGLIVLALTTSFAAFDWLMSLDGHWSSTIFGVYFWTGSLLGSLASLILLVLCVQSAGWLRKTITVDHLHDLGKLLFSFVVFWAYIGFCQYFLIWYANFPEETSWYITRRSENWNTLSWALFFGHFVVPFVLLLFRANRRSRFWLGFAAAWILVFHYLDLYWLVMPAMHAQRVQPEWLDASLVLMLVLTSCAIVARACRARPLVAVGDPRLAESLAFHNP